MYKRLSKIFIFSLWAIQCLSINAQTKKIPSQNSDINFTLNIPLESIEKAVNDNLPHVLLEDTSYTDNGGDDMKSKIYKSGKIQIQKYNDYLMQVIIPLKVEVDKRIGGIGVYTAQKFQFKMKMYCIISGEIDDKGNLKTETRIQRYEFEEEPVLRVAGLEIPITSLVESELNESKNEYAQAIDSQISENIPLKVVLLDLLQYFSSPILASEDYHAWVDFDCRKIQFTPFKIVHGMLQSQINLVSNLRVYLSSVPYNKPPLEYLPYIEEKTFLPNETRIQSFVAISKEEARNLVNATIQNQTYNFQEGKYSITVDSVKIDSEEDLFSIHLDTSGDFEGSISLVGSPFFDKDKNTIFIHNPEFRAKTKNVLYQTALWIKKREIQKQISEQYGVPIEENLRLIEQVLNEYLNTSYYNAVYLKSDSERLEVEDVWVTHNGLLLFYTLNYHLEVELKELRSF